MWDLAGPGIEPVFPALAGRFLTTAPPGKSPTGCFKRWERELDREAEQSSEGGKPGPERCWGPASCLGLDCAGRVGEGGLRKLALPPGVKAWNCSRVQKGGACVQQGPPTTQRVYSSDMCNAPPPDSPRERDRPCPVPHITTTPAPPPRRSPHRTSQGPASRRSCGSKRGRLRTRKLRYRRASGGRESAELLGRGWDHLSSARGSR